MREPRLLTALLAAALIAATCGIAAESPEQTDYSKKMQEQHRRNLPEYIRQLHLPSAQNSPYEYVQLVQWIANSRDPRAIPTMIEVMLDTMPRLTGGAKLIAAEFLGGIGDQKAIPALKANLTMERRFGSSAESARFTPVWNRAVHLGAAAALFQLGGLQAALPVFRSVLAMGDSDPRSVRSNAFQAVRTSIDAYSDRPKALDTIYRYFREATVSGNPELRAGAAFRLVGIDSELAFRVASAVLALKQPKGKDDIYRYHISVARRTAVSVLKAIGDTRAKLLLKTLAQDKDKSVRVAAECALRDIEQKE